MPWAEPNLTLSPFIFFHVCFAISIAPIIKFKESSLAKIRVANPSYLYILFLLFSIVAVVPFVENIIHVISIYGEESAVLSEIYDEKMEVGFDAAKTVYWLSTIGKIGNSVTGKFSLLLPFLLFYYLTFKKINTILLIGLILAAVNPLLFQLSIAGRGSLSFFILDVIFLYFLFRKKIPIERAKKIKLYGFVGILSAILLLSIITIVRKEGTGATFSNLQMVGFYLGKPHLSFNNDMWNIKQLTQGDNSFSFIKSILGIDTFTDFMARREFWNESKIGILPHIFYTYIGDIFMDFGAFGTLLLTLFVAFIIRNLTISPYSISLTRLFIFYLYYTIILHGWSILYLKTYGHTLNALLCILVVAILSSFKINKV